jgi:parvulin-like peptidyl-prolyl isomerase
MKSVWFPLFPLVASLCAQTAATPSAASIAALPPDTVIGTYGIGKTITAGEVQAVIRGVGPQGQQNFQRDPRGFINQVALMKHLSDLAAADKLDQESPTREQLLIQRMILLSNAKSEHALRHTLVTPDDQKKAYQQAKDRFFQVKVKAIYISFSSNPGAASSSGKKFLSEAEAKAKAEKLLADIKAGADFARLARENSDDSASAAKDGDFATLSRSDTIPAEIKEAVFQLKQGEVGGPVRQPNGFYLFKAEEIGMKPYEAVKDQLFTEIQQQRWRKWMEEQQKFVEVKPENENYFKPAAPPVPAQ